MPELMTFCEARECWLKEREKFPCLMMVCTKIGPASAYPGEKVMVVVNKDIAHMFIAEIK